MSFLQIIQARFRSLGIGRRKSILGDQCIEATRQPPLVRRLKMAEQCISSLEESVRTLEIENKKNEGIIYKEYERLIEDNRELQQQLVRVHAAFVNERKLYIEAERKLADTTKKAESSGFICYELRKENERINSDVEKYSTEALRLNEEAAKAKHEAINTHLSNDELIKKLYKLEAAYENVKILSAQTSDLQSELSIVNAEKTALQNRITELEHLLIIEKTKVKGHEIEAQKALVVESQLDTMLHKINTLQQQLKDTEELHIAEVRNLKHELEIAKDSKQFAEDKETTRLLEDLKRSKQMHQLWESPLNEDVLNQGLVILESHEERLELDLSTDVLYNATKKKLDTMKVLCKSFLA